MKKSAILFFVLLFAGTAFAQDKKLYVSFGPGIGLATARTYDLYVDYATPKATPVSLGTGLNINLRAGYCLSSFLAVEFGIVYRLGFNTKIDVIQTYSPEKATYTAGTEKFKSSMLQLVPAIVISPFAEDTKMRPYGRVGLIVGLMPSIVRNADVNNYAGTYNEKYIFRYSGGVAVGGTAAIGCDFNLNDMLDIYAEVYFNALGYAPTKGKYIKDEVNGTDVLPDMTTKEKEYEFVKDLSAYENGTQPDSEPTQTFKNSYTLNNAGLNVGVKIKL